MIDAIMALFTVTFRDITLSEFFLPAAGRLYSEQNIMKMTFSARQQFDVGRMTTQVATA
ncbi:hypothetical protein N4Q71_01060 [Salmonella enterica subsp. enterica serovar Montevideo]